MTAMPTPTPPPLPPLAAYIGLDWAGDHHDVALCVAGASTVETQRLAHTPEALGTWLADLARRFEGRPVGIALETSRGPLVHALLAAPCVVLYPVNPRSLRRFRETFAPSGAKGDGPDARLLLTLVSKHREVLRPWHPDDAATRTLRALAERRRSAVALRTQLTLQLQAALKEYFPQALDWAGTDLTLPMALAFLARWPTLAAVQRARPATLRAFYAHHRCRARARIAERLAAIATATPLTTDPSVIEPGVRYVRLLGAQLTALGPHIAEFEAAIAAAFAAHPDAALFQTLPGAGAALAPRLLVAFGTDRTRFPHVADFQCWTGIAPITVQSGRSRQVRWRWAAPTFVRQTFHEFAHHSVRHCAWARAFYAAQRARGHDHHVAVRALAYKWIRILWRCWQDQTPYDDARYVRALTDRGSPVARSLATAA